MIRRSLAGRSPLRRLHAFGMAQIFLFLIIASCNKENAKELIDRSGRTVVINRPIERVISTAPSNTEIIVDMGMAHKLVAVDVHSANIEGLPAGLAYLDFFYPDAEAILGLSPDLIIASGHNATGTGEDPLQLLREAGVAVAYISMSNSINDIYLDIEFVAELLSEKEKGERLIAKMKAEVEEIALLSKRALENKGKQPAVYFEISAAPDMMTFGEGSYFNDMIRILGAQNIFEKDGWFVMPGAEDIIQRNPDIIFTSVNYIDDPIGEIKSRPGFNHINAIANNRVYYIDNDSSSRSSARIVLALRQMAEAVHFLSTDYTD